MAEALRWPPTKEDPERLFATRISQCAYWSTCPKVAESTILHYLKESGFERKSQTERIRKETEAMVAGWARRHKAGRR